VVAVKPHLRRAWFDEWGWCALGNAQLRLGYLRIAEASLKRALDLAWCTTETRAFALYDLACVHARQGHGQECRAALEAAKAASPRSVEQAENDPDLESVRSAEWFADLIAKSAGGVNTAPAAVDPMP
jgi:hypothetical protein